MLRVEGAVDAEHRRIKIFKRLVSTIKHVAKRIVDSGRAGEP